MKYRNTLTGAILESSCVLSGGDWEEISEVVGIGKEIKEDNQETGEEDIDESSEKFEDGDVIDLEKMTVSELKKLAKELEIDIKNATKKDEIMKIIAESQQVVE